MPENKTTHSPGPWHMEGPDQFGDYNISQPDIYLAVAAVVSNLREPQQVKANARLVAAAPALLDAINKTRENLDGLSQSDDDIFASMVRRLDQAIERATGGGCPSCGSTAPHMHPAIQHEGEVRICRDAFHNVAERN